MVETADKIGVVREHRWIKAPDQVAVLQGRNRVVVSLGAWSSEKVRRVELSDLATLVRPGTIVELVHAFLLADPKRRRTKGGLQADFVRAIKLIVDNRKGVVVDVDANLSTAAGQRKAMTALAWLHIGKSNRGAKSAFNGAKSRGRPSKSFSAEQLRDAKAIWRNIKDFSDWQSVQDAFDADVPGFTTARAFKLWKGRL